MKALALAFLISATAATPAAAMTLPQDRAVKRPQAVSGLVIGAEIEGHVAVLDGRQRLIIEMDKTAGQPVRLGIDPGRYEVRVESKDGLTGTYVVVQDKTFTHVERDQLACAVDEPARAERPRAPEGWSMTPVRPRREAHHRIELQMGLYHSPTVRVSDNWRHAHAGYADVGAGIEYLHYVTPELGVGFAINSQARGDADWSWREDDVESGNATVSMPIVVRWNFARRMTEWRGIEPYVTAGVGPVFRADWTSTGWRHHSDTEAEVSTTLGGRLGVGFDARIGNVWTLGLMAGWRWSDRPDGVQGYGRHDRGGEVAFTMGWMFGRR